jgi:hypothetical protein
MGQQLSCNLYSPHRGVDGASVPLGCVTHEVAVGDVKPNLDVAVQVEVESKI